MRTNWEALIVALVIAVPAAGQSKEEQIAEAVLPLPEALRAGAKVIAYEADAKHSVLREGANGWICFPDEPTEGYRVGCYHEGLHPFVQRGRELSAEGKSGDESRSIRAAEVKSGKLKIPDYSLSFNLMGGQREMALPLTVVRVPFATKESTGLGTERDAYRPWLMRAGTVSAHIMFPGQ